MQITATVTYRSQIGSLVCTKNLNFKQKLIFSIAYSIPNRMEGEQVKPELIYGNPSVRPFISLRTTVCFEQLAK